MLCVIMILVSRIKEKTALIRRALYGGKLGGHDYWVHMF